MQRRNWWVLWARKCLRMTGIAPLPLVALALFSACEQSTAVPREAEGPSFTAEPLPPLESSCPDQRGMVGVPFRDGTCYLMDPWPVTRGEFFAVVSEGPLASQHNQCTDHPPSVGPRERTYYDALEGNTMGNYCAVAHALDESAGGTLTVDNRMPWPPGDAEVDEPMVCVTWCDAHAYCERVGKRLCNHRGLTEADLLTDMSVLHDPENDEFFNACTGGGTRASPTGVAWPSVEGEHRRIPPHQYLLISPLSRANLTEGGEGAFGGVWGLSVSVEFTGPMHFTERSFYVPNRPDLTLLRGACGAVRQGVDKQGAAHVSRNTSFGSNRTFRCCADAE